MTITFKQIVEIQPNSWNETSYVKIMFTVDGVDGCRFLKFQTHTPTEAEIMDKVSEYLKFVNISESVKLEQEIQQKQNELSRLQEDISIKQTEYNNTVIKEEAEK